MTRVSHILHAFSVQQIEFLIKLIKKEKTLSDEEKYALELLERSLVIRNCYFSLPNK